METATWTAAGAAVVAALVALAALYFTRQQVQTAKRQTDLQQRMHEDAAQPYVWADIRPSDTDGFLMLLVVHNEGPTVATDVTVTFTPPLVEHWDGRREDAEREDVRLASMPPGRTVRWYVGVGPAWHDTDDPKRFAVRVEATGPFGAMPPLTYDLDLDDFHDSAVQPPGSLRGVTDAVKDLTKQVKEQGRRAQSRK